MTTCEELIPDDEVLKVHANANFGTMKARQVVDHGVLTYALGYTSGSTALAILVEHKLVKKPKGASYSTTLTKKGQKYLRALLRFTTIQALLEAAQMGKRA